MTAVASRNVSVKSDILTNLMAKYELMEHQFQLVNLENEQYRKHIVGLQEEIQSLKEDVVCFKDNADIEQALTPVLNARISSMNEELNETDKQIAYLTESLRQHSLQIKALQSENAVLRKQNDRLNNCLINIQQTKCETNMSETALSPSSNQVKKLLEENEYLQNELNAMQSSLSQYGITAHAGSEDELSRLTESYSESHSPTPDPEFEEDDTIRFNFRQSFTTHKQTLFDKHLKSRTVDVSQRQLSFFSLGASQASQGSILHSMQSVHEQNEVSPILQKLEEENTELLQKLDKLEEENEDLRRLSNAKDMEEDVKCEEEEEDLFDTYEIEIDIEKPKYTLIDKFKFFGFELQLRRQKKYCEQILVNYKQQMICQELP